MRIIGKLGYLLAVGAFLSLSAPADAGIWTNKLAGNKLAGNKLAGNKLQSNLGDGAFTGVSAIELPSGIRYAH